MEPEGSLPYSQASATYPYPGPTQSSPHTHIPPPGGYLHIPLRKQFSSNYVSHPIVYIQSLIKNFFLQGKARKEIHAILTGTLACFLSGRAKNLSAHLYNLVNTFISVRHNPL